MSKKLPALHFYTGDWWKDDGVMVLNCEERGAWSQMLFIMHDNPQRRGYLEINGQPYPVDALARKIAIEPKKLEEILEKIKSFGIASVEKKTGILYSRRLVSDEEKRQILINNGVKGGRPKNQSDNQNVTKPITKTEPNSNQNPEDESEDENRFLSKKESLSEFEIRWKRYQGEKDGRKLALTHWNASVKTPKDLTDYDQAESNYYAIVEHARTNGFPERKYKGGKTWMNNWRDYIDQKPPPKKSNSPPKKNTDWKKQFESGDKVEPNEAKAFLSDFNKKLKGVS